MVGRNPALRRTPVEPGDVRTLTVDDLGHAGEGVGRLEGFALFLPGALPGERVRARVETVAHHYGRAALLEVETPSPDRVTPPCPVYSACGGCQLQHLRYEAQLAYKERRVRTALARIGRLPEVPVRPSLHAGQPLACRTKVQCPVAPAPAPRGARLLVGYYRRGTHEIVDIDDCPTAHPAANAALRAARAALEALEVPPYDERLHRGVLRHLAIRVAGEAVMLILVTRTRSLPRRAELVARLRATVPGLASLWHNVNPHRTNVIFGPASNLLWGAPALEEKLLGLRFRLGPTDFFQVNPRAAALLYQEVRRAVAEAAGSGAGSAGDEVEGEQRAGERGGGGRPVPAVARLVDVYSGVGTIALLLSPLAREVIGIEESPSAVATARANAALNDVPNVNFLAGRAEEVLPRLVGQGWRPEVVVVDPPRQGCQRPVLDAIEASGARHVVYVSCNPETLARDMARLSRSGYRPRWVQPVDLFPQTAHVEAVASLVRQG